MAVGRIGGYWIAPNGDVYEVTEHTLFIARHPELFGFDPDDERIKYYESYRDELVIDALRRGWIRVRLVRKGYDMVNFWRLNSRVIDNLLSFYESMPIAYWETPVVFTEVFTGIRKVMTPKEFFAGVFVEQPLLMFMYEIPYEVINKFFEEY